MEPINYAQLLPRQPQEDVIAFARQKGAFRENYLIYCADRAYEPLEERYRSEVRVVCTACGQTFYAEKIQAAGCSAAYAPAPFGWQNFNPNEVVISGKGTFCPLCGSEAKAVHTGAMSAHGELVDDAWVSTALRVEAEGVKPRFALLEWCIRRCINKQGAIRYEIWPYTAWVVEEKKIVRLVGFVRVYTRIRLFGYWEQRKTFSDSFGQGGDLMPWDPRLLEGTAAEHCKLDLYQAAGGEHLVSWLALWRRHPNAENLLVQGCGELVDAWIRRETRGSCYRGGVPRLEQVNWKEKRPAQMLGLTKEEFRQMRQGHWNAEDLEKYKLVRDSGVPVQLPKDMELLKEIRNYDCNMVLTEAPKEEFWRTVRYLHKQKEHWSTLRDYRNMARNAGRDMTDSLVRWPRNLTAAHNRYVEELQAARNRREAEKQAKIQQARRPLFAQRAGDLAWLSFTADGLLIRPCADEDELIREGNTLHHCVASYAKRHAEGKTAILFIRRADAPDTPFFTLELDEEKLAVIQNRGLRNCVRTPEVEAFEQIWLEHIRKEKALGRCKVA